MATRTSRASRRRRGAVLLAGAVAFGLLAVLVPLGFPWTPLGIGLAYLAAAAAGGREGGYWATALVLTGWGVAVVATGFLGLDVPAPGAYLAGAGIGALCGGVLARSGFDVDLLGAGATIAFAGVLVAAAPAWPEVLAQPGTYALAVALVGACNLIAPGALSARSVSARRGPGR